LRNGVALLFLAGTALIAGELAVGASTPTVRVPAPCASVPLYPGSGLDAVTQRIVLDGIARAACRLGLTREKLVLSLAPHSGTAVHVPAGRESRALRAGFGAALEAAVGRGDVPAALAPLLRNLVQHAPLEQLVTGRLP
jgi:hypothetical protein